MTHQVTTFILNRDEAFFIEQAMEFYIRRNFVQSDTKIDDLSFVLDLRRSIIAKLHALDEEGKK